MKTIVVNGQKFNMSETSGIFLKKYLKKMETYIKENNIEMEVYDDMEERVSERLSESMASKTKREVTDKVIIDIVNELGEPSEIFSELIGDEIGEKGDAHKKSFKEYFSIENGELTRNSEKGIFFGVCYGIAEKYGIDPLWVRLAFVFGVFLWGMTFILYLVLAFLLPDETDTKKKEYLVNNKNVTDTLKKGKNTIEALDNQVLKELKYVRDNGPGIMKRIFLFIIGVMKMLVIFILIAMVIPAAIGTLLAGGFMFTDFSYDNQRLLANVHLFLKIGLVGMDISIVLFMLGLIGKFFKGKFFSNVLMFTGFIGFLVFVFMSSIGGFNTMNNYKNIYSKTDTFEIENRQMIFDNLHIFGSENSIIEGLNWVDVEFVKSEKDTIKIEVVSIINSSSQEEADQILHQLTELELRTSSNIDFGLAEKLTFQKEVPYSFLRRKIIIHLPENNLDFTIQSFYENNINDINNIYYGEDGEYKEYRSYSKCRQSYLEYNTEKNIFVCKK